jgi:hypothetical protein
VRRSAGDSPLTKLGLVGNNHSCGAEKPTRILHGILWASPIEPGASAGVMPGLVRPVGEMSATDPVADAANNE